MTKIRVDPELADATLDMTKLRAFLAVPKAAVEAREATCACGACRSSEKPKARRKAKANR